MADVDASGGSYGEAVLQGEPTAWFPFTGDSVTYQARDYFRSDEVALYIDEVFQGTYDIRTGNAPTITHSFDNLGPGLHILKVRDYRDEPTLDAFITPAVSPPTPPPVPDVFARQEEDYPAILYNGLPYTNTASTWNRTDNVRRASNGQYIISSAPGDSVSLDFAGTWVQVGFVTGRESGQVEVFIDGISQGTVDLYSRDDDVASFSYGGLADTSHTVSATILGTRHPNSTGTEVMVDYFDTWSGDPLPAATYEEDHALIYRSDDYDDWVSASEGVASGGSYTTDAFQAEGTIWFPFTGDSVTFLGLANGDGDHVRIAIDGVPQGMFNLYSNTPMTRAFSFDGLGSGPHVMQIRHNRGEPNVDAFAVPGIAPFYEIPSEPGIVRYEEDHPAVAYNSLFDFRTRLQSWVVNKNITTVSGGWHVYSGGAGDTVSLTFDGRWVAAGFRVRNQSGEAEIFVDGVSQGVLDLSNGSGEDVRAYHFGDLITGTHTISVSVVAGTVYFDYFDVWDGQPMSDEIVNARRGEDSSRLHYSSNVRDASHANALAGDMVIPSLYYAASNVWYSFVGDSFTLLGMTHRNGSTVDVYVDGVFVATADFTYPYSEQPRAYHYTGFEDGPHVVRISNGSTMRVDAFQSNPEQTTPYLPIAEWWDNAPGGSTGSFGIPAGMLMGIAAGDLDGDGEVEIVAPSDTYLNGSQFVNSIFIYRGDGEDTGDGDPLIRRIDFTALGTGLGREYIGSVALADLDGQPGAEIVVGSERGMYALYHTGATYWFTDTFQGGSYATGVTPATGNLDLDEDPEIVANMDQTLVVYSAGGDIAWSQSYTTGVGMPLLADVTGDGLLDIVAYDLDGNVDLYDYNYGTPQRVWRTRLSTAVDSVRGGPAVADVDGNGTPEIAISHDGYHTVLDQDGNVVWSTELDPGAPGGVSVADVDGDGEIEIVTGMRHDDGTGVGRLYALNADGTILWERPAYDDTSANSQAVLDVDGDGVYEIAWNGAQYGFTIFNGADGAILFNEPLAESLTGTDYPLFADVDLDGYAEIVVPGNDGIVVFGQDGVWGESRPLWNQHSYHITNVNDDLTIPASEANSWQSHNTYRTQWPARAALPSYDVTLTYTAGISGVTVLTDTFSARPSAPADPSYRWDYTQTWAQSVVTRTFASALDELRPGGTRLVAQGTEVAYTLPSGSNRLTLPPLYVSAPHIVEVAPLSQTVGTGGTAVYTVTLTNPAATSDTYALVVSGLPAGWLTLPASIPLAANSSLTASLSVTVPAGTALSAWPFAVSVENESGGIDQAGASLALIDAVDVSISPGEQTVTTGSTLTYTLTISNHEAVERTYALTASGLANVTLPPLATVPANGSRSLPIQVSAGNNGRHPFAVHASSGNAGDSAHALLDAMGNWAVDLALAPVPAVAGPGTPTVVTMTVTNLGDVSDSYDLTLDLPDGWIYTLEANGINVDSLTLPPYAFNSADLELVITPGVDAAPGSYGITATATSHAQPAIATTIPGTVDVLNRGVQVAVTPSSASLSPTTNGVWQVTITNTGSVADSYWLTATSIVALGGQFANNSVTLNPGQATNVALTAAGFDFALPTIYPFSVAATSQSDSRVRSEDTASIRFGDYEAVDVSWRPASQTVTDTLSAVFLLVITNTGNVNTTFQLGLDADGLRGNLPLEAIAVPARTTAVLPLYVQAGSSGSYTIEGTATAAGTSDGDTATLTVVSTSQAPTADAGLGQTVDEGEMVTFSGSGQDPEGSTLAILWEFGDGTTASGTFTPTHTYADDGHYLVRLTVTDDAGLSASDTLIVAVENVAPAVNAGPDRAVEAGEAVQFSGAFSDPGELDTHTIEWDFGDGHVASGTLTPSHVYANAGTFTVTLMVVDDDSGRGTGTLTITVNESQQKRFLPIIARD